MADKYVFRRIRGRVVRIKVKSGMTDKQRTVAAEQAGVAGVAGVAVAASAGKFASKATRAAADIMNRAHDAKMTADRVKTMAVARLAKRTETVPNQAVLSFMAKNPIRYKPALEGLYTAANRLEHKASALHKSRLIIRRGGAGLAAGLFGYAAVKGIQAATGKDPEKSTAAKVFEIAAVAGSAIAGAAYYKQFGGTKAALRHVFKVVRRK